VLFHYNGHGVPRPTINGEIWLFNKVEIQLTIALLFEKFRSASGYVHLFDFKPSYMYSLVVEDVRSLLTTLNLKYRGICAMCCV